MKIKYYFILVLLLVANIFKLNSQNTPSHKTTVSVCNNEDFEIGQAGTVTSTAAVSGWNTFKLTFPNNPFPFNCMALTSTAVTRANPVSAELFTTNGFIDTIIGSGYPIYSVFGSGASNGGELYNPTIPTMYGNSFFRIGDASGAGYNHHSIEKTFSVTAANSLFRFAYISVLKAGTNCCEAPSVQVRFFNASQGNTLLACPIYSINAPNLGCSNPNNVPMTVSTGTFLGALDAYYHKWRIEAIDLSPYIGSNITFKMAVTYCAAGCAKYGYAYLDAQCGPMEILVNGTPFPANTNSVNFTSCGITTATVVAPPNFSNYQWTGPNGFTSTLSTITTSASGVYTLNILASNTCSTLTKYVSVNLYPTPTPTIVSTKTVSCVGSLVKLTASGLTTYTWNPETKNTTTINVTPTVTTTYTVSGSNVNGCFGTSAYTQSVVVCTGIENQLNQNQDIIVYPNPNNGEFTLRIDNKFNVAKILIHNPLGQLVYNSQIIQSETQIKTKNLPSGIYAYTIIIDNQVIQKNIINIE